MASPEVSKTQKTALHILIAEDDRDHRDLILRAFREDPDPFRISVADTVREAKEIAMRDPPDLIIADWNLPDGKGIDILTRVNDAVTIPLVVMTGYGDERLAVEIMKSGAVDYIVKSATVFENLPDISRKALRFWENIHERLRAEKAEQDSQKRLADILAFMPDPVLAIDNNGTVIAWNNAMEALTGVPATDMLGKGDYTYSIPFYGEQRPILVDLVLAEDTEIRKRYEYVQRDGDRITSEAFIASLSGGRGAHLWGTASPLYDTAGTRVGAIEVIRDITDRKRTEQIIRASEEKFRSLVEEVPDFIIVHRNGTLLFVNRAAEEATGFSAGDLLGRSMLEFVIPEDRERVSSATRRRMDGEVLEPYEIGIQTRSGEFRQVIIRGNRIAFDGAPASLNVLTDVTETRKGEKALLLNEVRFRDLFNNMGAGVIIYEANPDGTDFTIRDLNHAVETIEHVKKEEILNRSVLEVFSGVRKSGLFEVLHRVAKTGIAESHPVSIYRDNRISGWRENYVYKLPSGEIVAIYEDATKKKQAEEDRQRLLVTVQEEKEKLSVLLNSIADEVWFTDMNHRFTLANPRALKEFNLDPAECPGVESLAASLEILRPDGTPRPVEEAPPLRALTGEIIMGTEEIVRTPCTGELRYRQVSAAPVRNAGGVIIGSVSVVRDITERKRDEEKMRESEIRFGALIQNSSDIIRILDRDGTILYESESAGRILGYPPGSLIGLNSMDYLHPDDRERVKQDFQEVAEKTNPGTPTEFRIRKADGEYIWVDAIGTNLLDVPGVNGIVVTTRPIQQRKQAEEEINKTLRQLEQSESLLRKVYDILPIGLWLADKNGTLYYGNPAGVKIWGAEPHVPIEQYGVFKARRFPSGDEIAPDDWALAHTIREWATIKDEMLEIDAFDGRKKIVLNYTAPLFDAAGAIDGAIVVNQEITDRVKAEQALSENQARLATAMDIAGLVNWEFDVASGMFTFDDRFYTLYETTADREGGNLMSAETYMQEFVYPNDRPAVLASIQKILATTDPAYSTQVEHRITPRDGSIRTIIARFAPIMGPDGRVIRTYGANQDITNFKLMESEIRSLNTVLEQRVNDRTEALSKANDALEEENAQRLEAEVKLQAAYDEKVLLLKEIHHRVKNNLQIIASLLNLQSRYITDEATLAAIRESQNRVKAMALVHEKLYRSEDLAHIDLNDYITFLGTGLFQFYGAKGRGIRFRLDMHDVDVDINTAIPLGLIINELISNSLKYAFPNGRRGEVALTITQVEHTLTVIFHDDGIGMPEGLDWRNTHSLGLQLVTTLTDQMDGTIELDRTSGTQFTLVLHEKV